MNEDSESEPNSINTEDDDDEYQPKAVKSKKKKVGKVKNKKTSISKSQKNPKSKKNKEENSTKPSLSQETPLIVPLKDHSESEEDEFIKSRNRYKKRQKFTKEEDQFILDSYKGPYTRWNEIAEQLGTGRTGKLVRERYHNFLDQNYDHSPWDREDLAYLCGLVREVGTNWKIINHFFPRRTTTNIKNAFTTASKSFKLDRSKFVSKGEKSRHKTQIESKITQEMIDEIKSKVDDRISSSQDLDFKPILFD